MSTEIKKYDYSKLRGRIKEVLGTEGAYAKALGRSHNFITSVFNNKSFLTQADIDKSTDILNIEPRDIGIYFFTLKVHKNET